MMKILKKYVIPALLLPLILVAMVFWSEADKEIRILCQVSDSFENTAQLDRLIATAENSRLFYEGQGVYALKSHQNLRTSQCRYKTSDTILQAVEYRQFLSLENSMAKLLAVIFPAMMLFQLTLALGAPLGHLAWGGKYRKLPGSLRAGSAISALVYLIGMGLVSEFLGWTNIIGDAGVIKTGFWVCFGVFFLSTLLNVFAASEAERKYSIPVATLISAGAFIIAIS
jgi:hypothetical protein